jgi:hypothetical protein
MKILPRRFWEGLKKTYNNAEGSGEAVKTLLGKKRSFDLGWVCIEFYFFNVCHKHFLKKTKKGYKYFSKQKK